MTQVTPGVRKSGAKKSRLMRASGKLAAELETAEVADKQASSLTQTSKKSVGSKSENDDSCDEGACSVN